MNVFPLKWAPWHHFCRWKVMKTWTEPFQSSRKLWTVLSCLFLERQMSCRHFECFSSKTVAVVVLKMSLGEWERVYLRKWSGLARYAVISVCQRHSSSLLCLWNQSQAVHYLLSSTAVKLTCLVFHFKSYKYLKYILVSYSKEIFLTVLKLSQLFIVHQAFQSFMENYDNFL